MGWSGVMGRFPLRPIGTRPPRETPDIQKRFAAHVKAYEHAKLAIEFAEAGKEKEAKMEEAKAKKWLREFERLGGKVSPR